VVLVAMSTAFGVYAMSTAVGVDGIWVLKLIVLGLHWSVIKDMF
jgi:hypothetical protein